MTGAPSEQKERGFSSDVYIGGRLALSRLHQIFPPFGNAKFSENLKDPFSFETRLVAITMGIGQNRAKRSELLNILSNQQGMYEQLEANREALEDAEKERLKTQFPQAKQAIENAITLNEDNEKKLSNIQEKLTILAETVAKACANFSENIITNFEKLGATQIDQTKVEMITHNLQRVILKKQALSKDTKMNPKVRKEHLTTAEDQINSLMSDLVAMAPEAQQSQAQEIVSRETTQLTDVLDKFALDTDQLTALLNQYHDESSAATNVASTALNYRDVMQQDKKTIARIEQERATAEAIAEAAVPEPGSPAGG